MGFVYHMMMIAKAKIRQAVVKHVDEHIIIIEERWDCQMGKKVYLAGNPCTILNTCLFIKISCNPLFAN